MFGTLYYLNRSLGLTIDLGKQSSSSRSLVWSPHPNVIQEFLQIWPIFWKICILSPNIFWKTTKSCWIYYYLCAECPPMWQILQFSWWIFLTWAKFMAKCLHKDVTFIKTKKVANIATFVVWMSAWHIKQNLWQFLLAE